MANLRKKQLKNAISGEIDFDAIWGFKNFRNDFVDEGRGIEKVILLTEIL